MSGKTVASQSTNAPSTQAKRPVDATKGPLDAAELADAAIAAALVFSLLAIGRLLAAGTAFQVLGTVVFAVLAARHRTRTVVLAVTGTALFTVLLGGIGPLTQSIVAGLFGWTGGVSLAKKRSIPRTIALTLLVAWPPVSMATVGFFAVATELRELTFENVANQWDGLTNIMGGIGNAVGLGNADRVKEWGADRLDTLFRWWPLALPFAQMIISMLYALLVRRMSRRVLRGVNDALGPVEPLALEPPSSVVAPLPLSLVDSEIRRRDYLVNPSVSIAVDDGAHVAVAGRNGAGKSTLLDVLAGIVPNDDLARPGTPGLGHPGGTAYVSQRPEGQVLAPTVSEDIRWGAPDDVDVDGTLTLVGLEGFGERLTSELSGGELQRLALASALARQPSLLLADEITSMLDPVGREQINQLLRDINDRGVAVVRTSHLAGDLDEADEIVTIGEPQVHEPLGLLNTVYVGRPLLTLTDVSYVYDKGKPWERPVLVDIDITVHSGELLLITGSNGSGKSTLARIIAGLRSPTSGEVELAKRAPVPGASSDSDPGKIWRAIAFQHARLQLLRPTVEAELRSLAGAHDVNERGRQSAERIPLAVSALGLTDLLGSRVDALSGGQQRRVLLAGLLARGSDVFVLDEPLAGLDDDGRAQLADVVDDLRRRGAAVIVVSHDSTWGHERVTRVLRLDQGRLVDP